MKIIEKKTIVTSAYLVSDKDRISRLTRFLGKLALCYQLLLVACFHK